jgi:hypothetical protein
MLQKSLTNVSVDTAATAGQVDVLPFYLLIGGSPDRIPSASNTCSISTTQRFVWHSGETLVPMSNGQSTPQAARIGKEPNESRGATQQQYNGFALEEPAR